MAVSLTVSESVNGTLSDVLAGGEIGVDIGNVTNGAYTPLGTGQFINDGRQLLYVRHNAVTDPITGVKIYLDSITPALTGGNTYGGVKNAGQDKVDLLNMGQASGSSKDNSTGTSGGVWVEMDHLVNDTNRFNQATRPALVKIFGDSGTDGIDPASAFTLAADSMLYYNGASEIDATAPVAGSIGKTTDAALGNRSKLQFRLFVPTSWPDGGIVQWSHGIVFSFTSALCCFMILPNIVSYLS
jgi:hypothetical protein